jgi:hypothetical protein
MQLHSKPTDLSMLVRVVPFEPLLVLDSVPRDFKESRASRAAQDNAGANDCVRPDSCRGKTESTGKYSPGGEGDCAGAVRTDREVSSICRAPGMGQLCRCVEVGLSTGPMTGL